MGRPASRGDEGPPDERRGGTLRYVVRTFDVVTQEEVGNWGWDVVSDTIYFSPELRRLLGYQESEFGNTVDGGIATYIDPAERSRVGAEFAAAAAAGAPFDIEATLVRPDGAKLRLVTRGHPVYAVPADPMHRADARDRGDGPVDDDGDAGAGGTLCYVVRTFDAVTLMEVGNWGWNVATDAMYFTPEISRVVGYVESDFGGTVSGAVALYIDPDDRERVGAEFRAAADAAAPFAIDGTIIRSDGVRIQLLAKGQPVFPAVGDRQSLTPGRSARHSAERRLNSIMAESPILITTLDLSLRYVHANRPVAAYTGLTAERLVGRRPSELFVPAGAVVEAMAREALATGRTVRRDIEVELRHRTRVLDTSVFLLRDGLGVPVELCSMSSDVTELRRHEESSLARRQATDLIVSALSDDRFVVAREPVVDIDRGEIVSEEILARLVLPDGTVLAPGAFLPDAERFDLVQGIDLWMLGQALATAQARPVQVNLSGVTLSDGPACDQIIGALQENPRLAPRVIFEITETAAVRHLDAACAFADRLAALGCGLALDDFGTGYGTFTYLRRLPVRYLKIDHSFVSVLRGSEPDRKVVSSIIGIAKQFGLLTIAEGVEDAETLTILGELGADYAQGSHLGQPDRPDTCDS